MKLYLLYLLLMHFTNCLTQYVQNHVMSVAGMKNLVELEGLLIHEFDSYADALQLKIETIESFLNEVKAKQLQWKSNRAEFVANPLNAYSLIRRLHEDWNFFEIYMLKPVGQKQAKNINNLLDERAPQEIDIEDVSKAIVRIQTYYNLTGTDLAQGIINGQQYSTQLNTIECIRMAEYCESIHLSSLTYSWFNAAIHSYKSTRDLDLYADLFKYSPENLYHNYVQFLKGKEYYQLALDVLDQVSHLSTELWSLRRAVETTLQFRNVQPNFYTDPPTSIEIGCRDQFEPSKKLKCFYLIDHSRKFLLLAPFKVEMLSSDPYIAIYHNVIYDKEIEELLTVDLDSFEYNRSGDDSDSLKYTEVQRKANDALINRIMDMTGISVENDRDFHLYNYGVAGHESVYYDDEDESIMGIVFFLNTVPQGGAYAFPDLNISAKAIKGNALIWDLHSTNQSDVMHHVSCPVLVGSKWTLIKYLTDASEQMLMDDGNDHDLDY